MRWGALATGLLLCLEAGRARAASGDNWRDGCPAGHLGNPSDLSYASPDEVPPYPGTEPRLLGPAPQLDSALVPSRMLLAAPIYMHFASDDGAARARMIGGLAQMHLNVGPQGGASSLVEGFTLTVPALAILDGDVTATGPAPAPNEVGNMVLAASLNRYWLTSILDSSEAGAPATIAGLRNAWAVQATFAFRPWTYDANDATILLARTGFDPALFAPHPTFGGAFEWRTEGVGCYAPFIHLRLSLFGNEEASRQHWSIFAPETLAAGFAAASSATVMVQYGILFSGSTGPIAASLPMTVVHRVRFGLDVTGYSGALSVGAAFDVFLGNSLYDGTSLLVYASWNFGFGPALTPGKKHKDLYP